MSKKYYLMDKIARVTPYRVSKFPNPGVEVWHLACEPNFHICLCKDIDKRLNKVYASFYEYTWMSVVSACQEISELLNIPPEKFFVHGSVTYSHEDLREFVKIYYNSSTEKVKTE